MTDPAERFIEAAVRPLADNAELQVMAAQELRAAIQERPEGLAGDSCEQAAENLEQARPKSRWKTILYVATALVAILSAIPLARDYMRLRLASYALLAMTDPAAVGLPGLPFDRNVDQKVPGLFGPLSASERLLLFGDPSQPNAMERLWKSDPTNPAFFADYARSIGSSPDLPADFIHTADRLDPQNAWFRYFAAGMKSRGNVFSRQVPRHELKLNPNAPRYSIFNAVDQAETIRLFEEASRLPEMRSYEDELLLQRLKILPPGNDVLGRKLTNAYLEMTVPRRRLAWDFSNSLAARAEELAIAGDREGFMALTHAWEIFARRSIEASSSIDWPFRPLQAFTRSARLLGLDPAADRYSRMELAIEKRRDERSLRRSQLTKEWSGFAEAAGGILISGTAIETPPPVTLDDLIPGEMAAREMWRRIASALAGLLILVALLLASGSRFLRGLQARALSGALVKVLRPSDHRPLLVTGVVVPIVIHLLMEWMLPLTTASATPDAALSTFLRFAALAAVVLMLPALLAARLLATRLSVLGWPRPRAFSIVLLITMAVIAAAAGFTQSEPFLITGWVLAGAQIIVLGINLTVGVIACSRRKAVCFLTWARSLIPVYATALPLMALLVPFHHAREKHWTSLNLITKIEPGIPATNRYEYEVQEQVRKDLLQLLDAKP